jgi:uncharacterized protein (DUF58 family)
MLTRRGLALIGVAAVAFAMAVSFGARTLNAVVAPLVVAIGAGYVQAKRLDPPDLDVSVPAYGFRDETATATLTFSASNPFAGRVALDVDDGLDVDRDAVETAVGETTVEFDVRLVDRGEQRVGPVRVVASDVFGLFTRSFTHRIRETVLVFPRVHEVATPAAITALHEDGLVADDREFDQLREYERGDPLRDVHWKSSAKQPDGDLLVREFQPESERPEIEVVAEADGGRVDDVADAAASIALALLDAGFAVGLTTPGGRVGPADDDHQRTQLLTLLARMETGDVHDAELQRANVVVRGAAESDAAEVRIGDVASTFDEFAASEDAPADEPSAQRRVRTTESADPTPAASDGGEPR